MGEDYSKLAEAVLNIKPQTDRGPTTLNEEAYYILQRWHPHWKDLPLDRHGELSLELADKLRGWMELTNIDDGTDELFMDKD